MSRRAAAAIAAVLLVAGPARTGDDAGPVAAACGPDGCFEIASPHTAWPGPGVAVVSGRYGRLEAPAASAASVFVRGEGGAFELRPLALTRDGEARAAELADAFRAEAKARVAAGAGGAADRAIADGALPGPPPVPPPGPPAAFAVGAAPVAFADGADLAERAPAGALFARFRSVEAALRFTDLADRVASRLLAAAGDGGDHGTLRWALHDLLLPEVWAANPNGEKGCGECALVVGDVAGGRPSVALLLRVTDPVLHGMQTAAGLGYAAMPEHRWRPDDDPDPASRERRNFRAVAGDVEIVATSAGMLGAVRAPAGPAVAADPAWRTLRGAGPAEGEAFVAFADAGARERIFGPAARDRDAALRGARESAGLRWMADRLLGAGLLPELRRDRPASPRGAAPLAALVSARCTTDAKGADVLLAFADEASAEAARAALEVCARPFDGAAAACASNRREAAFPARAGREARDLAERAFVVLGRRPACPSGGTYEAHPVTREPSCSVHGTDARPLAAPPPKAILRGVARDGAVVRLRVPIAW